MRTLVNVCVRRVYFLVSDFTLTSPYQPYLCTVVWKLFRSYISENDFPRFTQSQPLSIPTVIKNTFHERETTSVDESILKETDHGDLNTSCFTVLGWGHVSYNKSDETPRVKSVTLNFNELLSRQTSGLSVLLYPVSTQVWVLKNRGTWITENSVKTGWKGKFSQTVSWKVWSGVQRSHTTENEFVGKLKGWRFKFTNVLVVLLGCTQDTRRALPTLFCSPCLRAKTFLSKREGKRNRIYEKNQIESVMVKNKR